MGQKKETFDEKMILGQFLVSEYSEKPIAMPTSTRKNEMISVSQKENHVAIVLVGFFFGQKEEANFNYCFQIDGIS